MARGDLDVDKKMGKDNELTIGSVAKVGLAPLILLDTIKNSTLAKDKSVMEELKKSVKDFPDSTFENQVEGIDVVTSWLPEFSKNNPGTAAALGLVVDFVDPVAVAGGTVAKKVGVKTLTDRLKSMSSRFADEAAGDHIRSLMTKKNMDNVPEMEAIVKKYNLRGELAKPEKLREKIKGKIEAQITGSGDTTVIKSKKTQKGTKDITGEKLAKVVERSKDKAPKISRPKIADTLARKVEADNVSKTVGNTRDLDAYQNTVNKILKPVDVKETTVKKRPTLLPKIADDSSNRLSSLADEATRIKEESLIPALPIEARSADVPPPTPMRSLEEVLSDMRRTREESRQVAKANRSIDRANTDAIINPGTETVTTVTPVISDVQEMWQLKKDIRKRISDPQWSQEFANNPQSIQDLRAISKEVDDSIIKSLEKVELPEGNAAELYKGLNNDFELQSQFLELVSKDTVGGWKENPLGYRGVVPATAAGAAVYATGGTLPQTAVGMAAGEGVRRSIMDITSAKKAQAWDRLSRESYARPTVHLMDEGGEMAAEATGIIPDRPNRETQEGLDSLPIDWSGYRGPNAVVEVPEAQDATEIMAPQPQLPDFSTMSSEEIDSIIPPTEMFTPPVSVNQEILNTPLPRDSKRLLSNPNVLLEKAKQAHPQAANVIQDMMASDPEGLVKNAPKVAAMFPVMFESDIVTGKQIGRAHV